MSARAGWSAAQVGYCSNVHPARSVADLQASIQQHFQGVRRQRGLAVQDSGLWISAQAAGELQQPAAREAFLGLLHDCGLRLTSLNGFPYGQFHQGAVKAEVYRPTWAEPQRLEYSLQLAELRNEAPRPDGPAGFMKSFNAALCDTCIDQVKAGYLRIGKPRSLRAAGVIFFGTPYRMGATLPIPQKTKADAELWITLEGWDGSMHQASIPLSQASPATIAWLAQRGAKP